MNSLIVVVGHGCDLDRRSHSSPRSRSRSYRFTGREVFVVLVIGIQMLPQVGLIIPLYVVLARYHQVNALLRR